MDAQVIEAQIHSVLDRVSNDEAVEVKDEWIEEAGEQFKDALRKQFTPREAGFRLRMSNLGRPLCQLQMQKAGEKASRMPYNHVMRMLIGDSAEVVTRLVLKIAGAAVTSDGDSVVLDVCGERIKGDSDIDLYGKVYDVKSTSPWGYRNKWQKGYAGVRDEDHFGYLGQLLGYSDAQDKEPGGWIVIDKSSGETLVVAAEMDDAEKARLRQQREHTVEAVNANEPFARLFEPIVETYYGKPTGGAKLPPVCTFCDYKAACWPTAQRLKAPASKAANPPVNWYVEHPAMETEE